LQYKVEKNACVEYDSSAAYMCVIMHKSTPVVAKRIAFSSFVDLVFA